MRKKKTVNPQTSRQQVIDRKIAKATGKAGKAAKEKLEIPCIVCGEMFPLEGIEDPGAFVCDTCFVPPVTDDIGANLDTECSGMADCECADCLETPEW